MFTDRFIKVPLELFNKDKAEIVGYNEDTKTCDTILSLLPFEVSHYRPAFEDGRETGTVIFMKNGDDFEISISLNEFEKLLNNHSGF